MGCRHLAQWLWLGAFLALPVLGQAQETKDAASLRSAEVVSCHYVAKPTPETPLTELEVHDDCAVLDENGNPKILAAHFGAISFDDDMASVLIRGQGWHYLRPDGSMLPVPTYDNGADYWEEGLVRTVRDGRIGFANRDFELVIEPLYDWAWPFEGGLALVCRGCRIEEGPGEHSTVVDGQWGVIDRSGGEVLPVAHSAEAARKFLRTTTR